jgi:drug/metabolite transporter (DMT)-like permease
VSAPSGNFRAGLLMVASMGIFSIEDAIIKVISREIPVGQILLVLGLGGMLVLSVFARSRGVPVFGRALLLPPMLLRNAGEFAGTIGFVTAIATIPLVTASVIIQAMPLLVTMGAALFLGERVGWRRWTAIFVGLTGVLVVLRPGLEGFRPEALWAVLGAFGLSLRDLATRRIPPDVPTLMLTVWGFGALVPAGGLLLALGQAPAWPSHGAALGLLATLALGLVGYSVFTIALRLGELSVIAPLRYSRIVFALILGTLFFSESPDAATLFGAALIVGAGLYTLAREARLARGPSPAPDAPL